jgi:ribosomal protein S27AE
MMAKDRPFPRYFAHCDGFGRDVAYVRVDSPTQAAVVCVGYEKPDAIYTLERCLEYVRAKYWYEIKAGHAAWHLEQAKARVARTARPCPRCGQAPIVRMADGDYRCQSPLCNARLRPDPETVRVVERVESDSKTERR